MFTPWRFHINAHPDARMHTCRVLMPWRLHTDAHIPCVDAVALAQGDELQDRLPQLVVLRNEVVVEDGRRARVREQVGVALVQVMGREGPVVERGAWQWGRRGKAD